jgi:hypothetical protein
MTMSPHEMKQLKRKATESTEGEETNVDEYTPPLTLPLIRARIEELAARVPSQKMTASLAPDKVDNLEEWCRHVRYVIRNFNLVLCFVSIAATIGNEWPPNRTGNVDQNIAALSEIKSDSSDVLDVVITPVNRILSPTMQTRIKKKTKITSGNVETEIYEYEDVVDDVEILELTRLQLCEEASDKRALLLMAMQNMAQCISDFIKADESSTHDHRSSMAY